MSERDASNDVFEIAVICSANRFRSPIAELILRTLNAGRPVRVSSYGVFALDDVPVLPQAEKFVRKLGLELAPHRCRNVSTADLRNTDLIVGFEGAHVTAAVSTAGADSAKTFTLPQIVRLLRDVGAPLPAHGNQARAARAAVSEANRRRASRLPSPGDEVRDPFGKSRRVQQRVAEEVIDLSHELSKLLFGHAPIAPEGDLPRSRRPTFMRRQLRRSARRRA